jgi:hypothetical protein
VINCRSRSNFSHFPQLIIATGLIATVLVGCSSAVGGRGSVAAGASGPSGSGTSSATSGPAGGNSPAALGATLEQIRLKNTDVGAGYSLVLQPGGGLVTGQVTLDNCGFDFTTERRRVH